jgi:hypothetical protein
MTPDNLRDVLAEATAPPRDCHPEDYCHRCGGPNISWYTPSGVWNPVMRPEGESGKWSEIICPQCFVELAGGGTWALIPVKDDGEAWTSADERTAIVAKARAEQAAADRERVEAVLDGPTIDGADRARLRAALVSFSCDCPPCPGRGNDGHGLTHCAECCFGSGVEADPDCPTHGRAALDSEGGV